MRPNTDINVNYFDFKEFKLIMHKRAAKTFAWNTVYKRILFYFNFLNFPSVSIFLFLFFFYFAAPLSSLRSDIFHTHCISNDRKISVHFHYVYVSVHTKQQKKVNDCLLSRRLCTKAYCHRKWSS